MYLSEPIEAAEHAPHAGENASRRLGALLVRSGRLSTDDAERVMDLQRREGWRFGEAALRLKLISERELRRALYRQYGVPAADANGGRLAESLVAVRRPSHAGTDQLRELRTQLLIRWLHRHDIVSEGGKPLVITSPGRNEGRSYVASNLAVLFAQLGERTLLIDADLRHPAQQRLFGVADRAGLSALLDGRAEVDRHVLHAIPGIPNLRLLPAGAPPPNPLELLSRHALRSALTALRREFDVILIDSPPAMDYPDAAALSFIAGHAVLLARHDRTRLADAATVARQLVDTGAAVVGSVATRF